MTGDSFVSNVNYLASLDNKYGKSITLDKNNITMGVLDYSVVSTITVYNQSTLELDVTEVGNSIVNSSTLGDYFDTVVSAIESAYPSVSATSVVDVNGSDMSVVFSIVGTEVLYEFNVKFTESGFEKYNIYGTIVNPIKILPFFSQLDSKAISGINLINDNIDSIDAIAELDPADIASLGSVSGSIKEVSDNLDNILLASNTVGLTVASDPVAYNVPSSVDYDNTTNTMTVSLSKGKPGSDGLTPIYELDYDNITGLVKLVLTGYENINGSAAVQEW